MDLKEPKGLICQSCAIPMEKEDYFGTNADGSKNQEYCFFCFQNGEFTEPKITLEEMIDKVAGFMVNERNIEENKAKEIAKTSIPPLKRWQNK